MTKPAAADFVRHSTFVIGHQATGSSLVLGRVILVSSFDIPPQHFLTREAMR
jgi:hypothetical protein